ncbi:hypothetical protein P872_24795 [Rhodonellum psychrophilum GCM71 = DSM 17998]|uniref:Uncharacterized protein n=1 Tax=Rhodonellum psychrophilum GCM71 = DSM 17998 TaxID=1123057 RepID=U5C3K2_9BACT|nr:hypothetical protein P872_24795 [Rhodonellum psychrophilum GCM71 = DSM 17998]
MELASNCIGLVACIVKFGKLFQNCYAGEFIICFIVVNQKFSITSMELSHFEISVSLDFQLRREHPVRFLSLFIFFK